MVPPPSSKLQCEIKPPVVCAELTKVAVTEVAELMVSVQAFVPEHPPPDQPAKVEPASGVAVTVTVVPGVKVAEQALPQKMPPALEPIRPVPELDLVTVSMSLS